MEQVDQRGNFYGTSWERSNRSQITGDFGAASGETADIDTEPVHM